MQLQRIAALPMARFTCCGWRTPCRTMSATSASAACDEGSRDGVAAMKKARLCAGLFIRASVNIFPSRSSCGLASFHFFVEPPIVPERSSHEAPAFIEAVVAGERKENGSTFFILRTNCATRRQRRQTRQQPSKIEVAKKSLYIHSLCFPCSGGACMHSAANPSLLRLDAIKWR